MFKELAPLVRHRAVLFTFSHVQDDQFRVNVIPKRLSDGENQALTTPVTVTGTIEDLDRDLPDTLLHFVSSHLELRNTLERARAEMEEASRIARAEARKRSSSEAKRATPAGSSSKPAEMSERPSLEKPEIRKPASLFDPAPASASYSVADGTDPGGARSSGTEAQFDDEEEILRDSYADNEDESRQLGQEAPGRQCFLRRTL